MLPFISALVSSGLPPNLAPSWNPADKASSITLSNDNRTATGSVSSAFRSVRSTASASTGKWFFEILVTFTSNAYVGMASSALLLDSQFIGQATDSAGFGSNGAWWQNGSSTSGNPMYASGDVIGVAIDFSAGKIWFGKNGTWTGDPATNTGGVSYSPGATQFPGYSTYTFGDSGTLRVPTTFALPSGFTAFT